MARPPSSGPTGRTAWVRAAQPLRAFVATEVGSALVLLAAAIAALVWANSPWGGSYEAFWSSELSIRLGGAELSLHLREWVNDGLMTFFFFVIGLEIRRELDMGELRDRRRVTVPVLAAIGGMAIPALLYVAFNAGTRAVHGWGVVMATDTAFALGVLALVGRSWSLRARIFVLTLVVVDDVGALLVIAMAYTDNLALPALLAAGAIFGAVILLRRLGVRHGAPYLLLGLALWLALLNSGVHPTIAGVTMGLLATAYPPSRSDLQQAASLWRSFREQPTYGFARSAARGVSLAISPNERMQELFHPWTSFVIVPVFALANAGVALSADLLRTALTSPITLGIATGLVLGKLTGITLVSWLATRPRLGGAPIALPWPPLVGAAAVCGIGFTVSLFIAELSFSDTALEQAKVGILAASVLAAGVGWFIFRIIERLPQRAWGAGAQGTVEPIVDLVDAVDPERDHIRGPDDAPVTLVEYGDFECPYCGQAEPVIRDLLARFGAELRYVFRHLPLEEVHEHAQQAAEAAEVAAAQGKFWQMHDLLFSHQDALGPEQLSEYAAEIGLDVELFKEKLRKRRYAARVSRDIESADLSGVTGTPTFFANGRRHHGAFDLGTLTQLVRTTLAQSRGPGPAAMRRGQPS